MVKLLIIALLCTTIEIVSVTLCFGQDPELLLRRAIKNLEALHSNCLVVGSLHYSDVTPDEYKERVESRITINMAKTPGLDDEMRVVAVLRTGLASGPPGFPPAPSKANFYEVVAKVGADWYWADSGELEKTSLQLVERTLTNYEEVANRITQEKLEFASLPLLPLFSFLETDCSLAAVERKFDSKQKHHLVFHSSDRNTHEGEVAGIWLSKNGSGLTRIVFSNACGGMPTEYEHYSRDPNKPFKEGQRKGDLIYRTTTTWQIRNGVAFPMRILLEVHDSAIPLRRKEILVRCAWEVGLNRKLLTEKDAFLMPFAQNSPLCEAVDELREELDANQKTK